jgi:hypothetical protein
MDNTVSLERTMRIHLAAVFFLCAACGSSTRDPSASDDAGADGSVEPPGPDAAPDAPPPPPPLPPATVDGTGIHLGPIPAAPGAENTMCAVIDLGNAGPLYVRELSTTLHQGSHHLIVSRTDEPVAPNPVPCEPNIQDGTMLFIGQSHDNHLRYPDAAALMLGAHQHIRLEIHFFNDTAGPLDIGADIAFVPHEGDTTGLRPVQTTFTGELSLSVPLGASTTTSYVEMPTGASYFALTTHTHRLGVLATLHRASSLEDQAGALLHESRSWGEPPLTLFDPPITFGGDGLLLNCHYQNDTGSPVGFGLSALDEMCFLWGYYY